MPPLSHAQRLCALSALLERYSPLWREAPFYGLPLAWQHQYPALSAALLALTNDELQALDQSSDALYAFLGTHVSGFSELLPYLRLPSKEQHIKTDRFAARDIPGRKWQQITAFIGAMPPLVTNGSAPRLLDWCAGKAHLGRTAAAHWGCRLRAVEHDPQLCAHGQALAQQREVSAQFDCVDVLTTPLSLDKEQQVVALHACGDLHRQLVRLFNNSDCPQLVLAPCCYDKWLKHDYQPLSALGKQQNLTLTTTQVKLAMQEAVTAPAREQAMMHELKILRLAFDRWQREQRGIDEYLPTPSLPLAAVRWGAQRVLAVLAEKKGLPMPADVDPSPYVAHARQHYQQIRRLQLASHGFRRALEVWLVSDLALLLEEGGCTVELQEFCARALTPRNIQLIASR